MRRTFITVATLVIAATTTLTTTVTRADAATDLTRGGVHLIGDSIAYHVAKGPLAPGKRPPGWTTDAFPGRRLSALDTYYIPKTTVYGQAIHHAFTIQRTSRIRTAVLELGTNGMDGDISVTEAARIYEEAVRRVRYQDVWHTGPKRVVLITPWKDTSIAPGAINPGTGKEYPPYTWAYKGKVYADAIRQVAARNRYVCVMPWDKVVAANPSLLQDGIHPTYAGRFVYRDLLFKTIRTCGP